MFQYAAACALAEERGASIGLDLRWMRRYSHRKFELGEFPLDVRELNCVERLGMTFWPFSRNPPYLWIRALSKFRQRIHMEKSLEYDPDVACLKDGSYLWGYFQSLKYFQTHQKKIRECFKREANTSIYTTECLRAVGNSNSVAVQIRRGDYVTNKAANHSIGVLPLDYYQRAIKLVKELTHTDCFCVFSDDILWCRQHLQLPHATFVERRGGGPVDDLSLAAQCTHLIAANSTFSWWSAWLNQHESRVVIVPARWYRSDDLDRQSSDLIPDEWIRV